MPTSALLQLGFRPLFALAGLFAVVAMGMWFWIYHIAPTLVQITALTTITWHAHEMIYGYTLAVVAGFLLTAVTNWTGIQTLHGRALLVLSMLWMTARVMPFIDFPFALHVMALTDLSFLIWLCIALAIPIIQSKQWRQLAVWSKLCVLLIFHTLFYLGLFEKLPAGIHWGISGGLYLIVSLLLMMGRRVIPFFIEKGIDGATTIRNRRWVDVSSLLLMLVFLVLEVFFPATLFSAFIALLLCIVHTIRLYDWHQPGLWHKPLLWVLYVAYAWIVFGFALRAAMIIWPISINFAIHAFAVGGIGLMTLGMMARVALGHTGRSVANPPAILHWIFLLGTLSAVTRIGLPLILPNLYTIWIGLSQLLWISVFLIFCWTYLPILVQPRIDAKPE